MTNVFYKVLYELHFLEYIDRESSQDHFLSFLPRSLEQEIVCIKLVGDIENNLCGFS